MTEVLPFQTFYAAQLDHQDYIKKNPSGYSCHFVRDFSSDIFYHSTEALSRGYFFQSCYERNVSVLHFLTSAEKFYRNLKLAPLFDSQHFY